MRGIEACRAVLATIEQYYADSEIELPDRREVAAGVVPYDCEQLSVSLIGHYNIGRASGAPGSTVEIMVEGLSWYGSLMEVVLVRCAPIISQDGSGIVMPTVAEIEDYGERIGRDALMLPDALYWGWQEGRFGEQPGMALEDWTAVGPLGDLGGGSLRVRLDV